MVFYFADSSGHAMQDKAGGKLEHSKQDHADGQDRGRHVNDVARANIVKNGRSAGEAAGGDKCDGKSAEEGQGFIIAEEGEDGGQNPQAVV